MLIFFHSIQLVCLCAFNSMKASILIIWTFCTFEYNFFPATFLQPCKTTKAPTTKTKSKQKVKQEQIKNALIILSLKFLFCAGMSNRYVIELVRLIGYIA